MWSCRQAAGKTSGKTTVTGACPLTTDRGTWAPCTRPRLFSAHEHSCSLAYVFHSIDLVWQPQLLVRPDIFFLTFIRHVNKCLFISFAHFSDRPVIFFLINGWFFICSEFKTSISSTHCRHFIHLGLVFLLWCVCFFPQKDSELSCSYMWPNFSLWLVLLYLTWEALPHLNERLCCEFLGSTLFLFRYLIYVFLYDVR